MMYKEEGVRKFVYYITSELKTRIQYRSSLSEYPPPNSDTCESEPDNNRIVVLPR